jgi:diguanylate cyclase (GGDEF)-like protein
VAAALVYAWYIAAGFPASIGDWMDLWVYNGAVALAGVSCLARATLFRAGRLAWSMFGLGLLAWAAGDFYWVAAFTDVRKVPYPSLADAGYLAALPCFYVGVGSLIRARIGHFTAASWLDGAIGGLAAAALGTAVLAPALVGLTKGDTAAVVTNLAYPLGDILLISFLVSGLVISGFRGAGAILAIVAGLAVWTVGDGLYLYQEATSGYNGGWIDETWLAGAALIGAAAAFSLGHAPRRQPAYRSPIFFPALFATVAAATLAWDHYNPVHEASVWLAVATLLAVVLRLAISFRENATLMGALHDDAVTDPLTGLGNRRLLMTDLDAVLGERGRDGRHVLALYDLDGFKSYNDTFGHPAGDSLLKRLGANLRQAIIADGRVYRLGGDEFCVLARLDGQRVGPISEAARAALADTGEGFSVSASCGAVTVPDEAASASDALRIADQRMYAEKNSGRVERQTSDLLTRIQREREPSLTNHHRDVAELAVEVGRELGLDAEDIDVVRRAGELHDIGKIGIPDEILHKPGPLDANEWELMRKHTLIGERIIGASPALAPVARIVGASHERWDGHGYPRGLAGEETPLGARIIFACDAYDAMRSSRPYADSLGQDEALTELCRNAGTQFDPAVVPVVCRVVERLAAERHQAAQPVL